MSEPEARCPEDHERAGGPRFDGGPIVLRTNMGAGHGAAAGRFDRLEEVATAYAFALQVVKTRLGATAGAAS